ncbi:nitroreductase family protein [Nocardia abscessus]|uniref:nitroreductase family protein n=1 Tax=Nocardia abscessus TaxID=120957 RepID=UPI003CC80894
MEFSEVLRQRRMVRHYTAQPLERDVIERVVRSALRAPSAGYAQGWAFLVLTSEADRERFWRFAPVRAERAPAVQNAPLIVVPMSNKDAYLDRYTESDKGWTHRDEARWPAPYWHIDTGMAAFAMLLTAVDEGLGACHHARASRGVPCRVRRSGYVRPDRCDHRWLPCHRPAFGPVPSAAAWCRGCCSRRVLGPRLARWSKLVG